MSFKSLLDFTLLTEFKGFFCFDLSDLCLKSLPKQDQETLGKIFSKLESIFREKLFSPKEFISKDELLGSFYQVQNDVNINTIL